MSCKYRTRLERNWSSDLGEDVHHVGTVVFEQEDGTPTGILDKTGCEIYRYEDRGKLGFVLR